MTLPKASQGIEFLFKPDFSKITPSVVIGALGQAFFSLSLGLGAMLTYASYFKENTDIVKSANITAIADTVIAIMASILIFPAVFSFGFSPSGGPRLVFEVLPAIFSQIPGGTVWSLLFFFMLFLASLTSTISLFENLVAFATEKTEMNRKKASGLITIFVTILGILCALSFSYFSGINIPVIGKLDFFNWFDYISSNILLPLGGMLISIFVGWIIKKEYIIKFLLINGDKREPSKFRKIIVNQIYIFIRYVAPVLIALIFLITII